MWSPDEQAPQAIPASSNSTTATMNLRLFITPNNAARRYLLCPSKHTFYPQAVFFSPPFSKKYVFLQFKSFIKMSHKTAIKVYEIASYVLILGATAAYFLLKTSDLRLSLTMILVALAILMRMMMERHRFRSAEEEIDQLKDDLRRLTQLYAEEKKKNKN